MGQNPAKFIETVSQPEQVTVAVLTYIPFLGGYYTQSLEVLKTCLNSIWQNTPDPYDLLVFDNASCPEVRQYLQDAHQAGKIQYLMLSNRNIGKSGAWNLIFGAAPGEYIAYADSDIYFYPGWLSAHLKVFEEFPNAGMVTGIPMCSSAEFSSSTIQWAEN
ncbi:MAG TPA: glycosyltransferase family A protein, partial [Anaerolineales bacterium]|nr:glycosyltransferase family A protein [Anaerolineales bacterium]